MIAEWNDGNDLKDSSKSVSEKINLPSNHYKGSQSDSDSVQWVDGYEKLRAKDLDAEEADSSADSEPDWKLPEDYDELDTEVLSSLPVHLRKSLIEAARRKERMKSRANYLPVADDPFLYSQTQLANFLSTRYPLFVRICYVCIGVLLNSTS